MFFLQSNAQIHFYCSPVNLHKGFDRLTAIVQNELDVEFNSHTYFLFCNAKKDRVKILYLDGSNLAIWCKRLDGTLTFKYSGETIVFDLKSFLIFLEKITFRRRRRLVNLA